MPAEKPADLRVADAITVDCAAARDAGKPADRRGTWHVLEDTMTPAGPRKKGPALTLRRIFVYSSARADGRHRPGQQAPARPRRSGPPGTRT
ncbi:hypothetical protein ACFQ08_34845, partial [Streptosporangium algeriense]